MAILFCWCWCWYWFCCLCCCSCNRSWAIIIWFCWSWSPDIVIRWLSPIIVAANGWMLGSVLATPRGTIAGSWPACAGSWRTDAIGVAEGSYALILCDALIWFWGSGDDKIDWVEFMPETDAATFWLLMVFMLFSIPLEPDPDMGDKIGSSPISCRDCDIAATPDPLFSPNVEVTAVGRGDIDEKLGHRSLGSMGAFLSFNDVRFIFACRWGIPRRNNLVFDCRWHEQDIAIHSQWALRQHIERTNTICNWITISTFVSSPRDNVSRRQYREELCGIPKRWPVWWTSCNLSAQSTSGEPPWKSVLGLKFAMTAREAATQSRRKELMFIRGGSEVKRQVQEISTFISVFRAKNQTSLVIPKRGLFTTVLNSCYVVLVYQYSPGSDSI